LESKSDPNTDPLPPLPSIATALIVTKFVGEDRKGILRVRIKIREVKASALNEWRIEGESLVDKVVTLLWWFFPFCPG